MEELRDWKVDRGDIRSNPDIAREMLEFIEEHQVKSVAITDGIIGCPHQEGIDYDGEWFGTDEIGSQDNGCIKFCGRTTTAPRTLALIRSRAG